MIFEIQSLYLHYKSKQDIYYISLTKDTIMLKNKLIISLCLLCSIAFIGCDEEDGKWDPIQITVNGNRCKSSTYKVSADGGEYKIYSKNYGELWLNAVEEDGKTVWPEEYDWSNYKNIHLAKEWYEIQYDSSGNIAVNIKAKEKASDSRTLKFEVECGDAFGSITLLQE